MNGILGIIVFLVLGFLFSENKKAINWKLVSSAILLQLFIAIVLLKFPLINKAIASLNEIVLSLDRASKAGTQFMFGYLGGGATPFEVVNPSANFVLAFQILPLILVVGAISSVLFHYGILQKIVLGLSWILNKTLKIDGATCLGVAASVFLGIIEAPLFIKPYLTNMSRSSLFTLITAAMATVAGTVMVLYSSILSSVVSNAPGQILIASLMSAPAAIMFAQVMIPMDKQTISKQTNIAQLKSDTKSPFEAIINGTMDGLNMILAISATLIVVFSLVTLINMVLSIIPLENPLTLQAIGAYIFYPFVWLMGIQSSEVWVASELMSTKTILNEFIAYTQLAKTDNLSESTKIILTYAMCGFANFGSLGILLGGLTPLIPDRKNEIIGLSLKALMSGTLATMFTGTMIGLLSLFFL